MPSLQHRLANLGENLRLARLHRKLTAGQLAERAGGELWIYPEIMDMLELRAQNEEADKTEKTNVHTRSRHNLLREKIQTYADHPIDRTRLHTVQLPY